MIRNFIGDKAFYQKVLAVAIPMMLQQMLSSFVSIVDNLIVGQVGDSAVAAIALVNRYFMISFFAIIGFTSIAGVFIAQYAGAKNPSKMQETFRISFLTSGVLAIPFLLGGLFFSKEIVSFFSNQTSGPLVDEGILVLRIITISLIPTAISVNIANAMRAVYDTKKPFIASLVAIVVNVTLDFSFLYGWFFLPKWGVIGVAIATLMARIVEMTILVIFLIRKDYQFKSKISESFKVTADLAFTMIKKGLPLTLNEIVWASGMSLLWKFYATRGESVLTSFAISSTTSDIFFSLFSGMAVATTIMVAHNLGANELDTARKNAYQLIFFSAMMSFVFGGLIYLTSLALPLLYTKVTPSSLALSQHILQVMAFFFVIYMLNVECFFILRAGGAIRQALILDSGYMLFINLPTVAFFTYFTNLPVLTLYLIGQSVDIIKLIIAFSILRQENWVNNLTVTPTLKEA